MKKHDCNPKIMYSTGSLLEIGIKVEKGLSGTKMPDSGLDPRGITVIVQVRIIIEHHTLSKALSEWRYQDTGIKPQPEPASLLLENWVPAARQARGLVATGQPGFQLVPTISGHKYQRMEVAGCLAREQHNEHRYYSQFEHQSLHFFSSFLVCFEQQSWIVKWLILA